MMKSSVVRLLCSLALISLVSCGESEDADTRAVSFQHIPAKPVVINSDTAFDDPGSTASPPDKIAVTGPWFIGQHEIFNGSVQEVTIMAMKYTITAIKKDGSLTTSSFEITPDDLPENKDTDTTNDSDEIANLQSGETYAPGTFWYIGSLPKAEDVAALNYKVEIQLSGWFGPLLAPLKTFNKKITIRAEGKK